MADNIKILGNFKSNTKVPRYAVEDTNLITSFKYQQNFGEVNDYIEYFIYDAGGNLLNTSYNYLNYKLPPSTGLQPGVPTPPNTTGNIQTENVGVESTLAPTTSSLYPIIEIDPVNDLKNKGYSSGEFNIRYNFFHNKISNSTDKALFVKEISPDRTEIRLASTTLTDAEIESTVNSIIDDIDNSNFYRYYLLNFGNNEQYVTINIVLNKAVTGYEILFKLYKPLPKTVQEKRTLWVVEEKVLPYVFDINLDKLITLPPSSYLKGPNFNIKIDNQGTVSTPYNNYSNLITSLQSLQQTSFHQISNLLLTQSIDINIDYTDFNNFVFYGSAYHRLYNFYDKVSQIEYYNNFINVSSSFTSSIPSLITEINRYSSSVVNIVSQFDGYEYYLYFESSSYAWPKANSNKPYQLLSTGSATVINWYTNLTGSAQSYDLDNYDNLEYAIPNFVRDDENNAPFLLFLNMVGHYFDNIWIYLKSITDINLANNNLEAGISKDLVYERLKSLGVHLYNSRAGESVDQYLVGANTGSNLLPSVSTPGNDFSITGSYLNNIPRKDLLSELYKRIYHNLPLLVKTKGTVAGLEHLITTFGITGSILNVKEFGGALKQDYIKGYNNDKVRIVSNAITGSVLSPDHSFQTSPSSTTQFRDEDTHFVDISFSPETQIDTYTSGAIASNNPTWLIDDYIGNPSQLYSSSYSDLETQRKLYYQTGVTNYPGFTGSLMDYNGFIRLIQYFDNALFKMLEDFTPERTSLSTGVTINSPMLERNKVAYSDPTNSTKQDVKSGEIAPSTISPQYGILYNALQDDKKPYFTGEFTGSIINVHNDFEKNNFNPYLYDWSVWNAQNSPTQSINLNSFLHSDFNVLLNNVSASVTSSFRQRIEYDYDGSTPVHTSSAELQDYYLNLRSYQISRYEGSKLTSLLYNTYTSASYTSSDNTVVQLNGDTSFGKSAVIDRQSYKIGWVKNIPATNLNFPDKTIVTLKYLVDKDSGLTELSSGNFNLFEVQNIFKSQKNSIVSISNNTSPSNQKLLEGPKIVFKGGISYDPVYFRESNEVAQFKFDVPYSSSTEYPGAKAFQDDWIWYKSEAVWASSGIFGPNAALINNSPLHVSTDWNQPRMYFPGHHYFSSDDPSGGRNLDQHKVTDAPLASARYEGNQNYVNSSPPVAQSSSAQNWKYDNLGDNINTKLINFNGACAWGSNLRQKSEQVYQIDYGSKPGNLFNFHNTGSPGRGPTIGDGYDTDLKYNNVASFKKIDNNSDMYYYVAPRASISYQLFLNLVMNFTVEDSLPGSLAFKLVGIIEKLPSGQLDLDNNWNIVKDNNGKYLITHLQCYSNNIPTSDLNWDSSTNQIWWDSVHKGQFDFTVNCYLNDVTNGFFTLNQGDALRVKLFWIDNGCVFGFNCDTQPFKTTSGAQLVSFNIGTGNNYLIVEDRSTPKTIYYDTKTVSTTNFLQQNTGIPNGAFVNSFYNQFFETASQFDPTGIYSSRYYSQVVDRFLIEKGDLLRISSWNDPSHTYYEITDVKLVNGFYTLTFDKPIQPGWNNGSSCAILKPKPNETTVILDYRKIQPGDVAQSVLIPEDINAATKANIGTIYKTLNTSLQ